MNSAAKNLEAIVNNEALLWGDNVAGAYHLDAEAATNLHWDNLIRPAIDSIKLDMSSCVDFACGRGRNAAKLLSTGATKITLVDVNEENINYCRNRFSGQQALQYVINNGFDLSGIPNSSISLFFTLDAMVHFDVEIVISYISEIARVLTAGGVAVVHHSNYTSNPGNDFRDNPHWRNYMSGDIFRHVAMRRGLQILRQNIVGWGDIPDSDCVTVMKKPL